MKRTGVALLALTLSLGSVAGKAESLRDIYELALENDAQLKAEEATYRANREAENLGLSALLPQIGANYSRSGSDTETDSESFLLDQEEGLTTVNTTTNNDTISDGFTVSLNQALFDLPAWFGFKAGEGAHQTGGGHLRRQPAEPDRTGGRCLPGGVAGPG